MNGEKKKSGRKYVLRLYVAGETPNSIRAINNIKALLAGELKGLYELQIVDVMKNPQLAEDEKILATPMLSRILPLPLRRIIGDLGAKDRVLIGLDLA